MNRDEFDSLADALTKAYKDTYLNTWEDEAEEIMKPAKPTYNFEKLLGEVMSELHRSGQDTFIALKNDKLRDWWSVELAKIKREEAKAAARERAKNLLSKEERELLGMKF